MPRNFFGWLAALGTRMGGRVPARQPRGGVKTPVLFCTCRTKHLVNSRIRVYSNSSILSRKSTVQSIHNHNSYRHVCLIVIRHSCHVYIPVVDTHACIHIRAHARTRRTCTRTACQRPVFSLSMSSACLDERLCLRHPAQVLCLQHSVRVARCEN